VLCHLCYDLIHRLPMQVKDQRAIVSSRSFFVRKDIRKILGYTPAPYTPPGSIDVPQMYDDYFYNIPPGSFRMSG